MGALDAAILLAFAAYAIAAGLAILFGIINLLGARKTGGFQKLLVFGLLAILAGFIAHGGTHVDAPIHFYEGRRTLEQIPVSQLIGPAVVVDVGEAVAAPRMHFDGELLQLEPGLDDAAIAALAQRWPLNRWPERNLYFGGVHAVAPGAEAGRAGARERKGAGDPALRSRDRRRGDRGQRLRHARLAPPAERVRVGSQRYLRGDSYVPI